MPIPAGVLLGSGLAVAALTGAVPLLFGGQVFQSAIIEFTLPVFGDIKFVTATIFDIGVYLVVVGLVIDVLRSLGSEVDRRSEAEGAAQAEAEQRRREAQADAAAALAASRNSADSTVLASPSHNGTTDDRRRGSGGASAGATSAHTGSGHAGGSDLGTGTVAP